MSHHLFHAPTIWGVIACLWLPALLLALREAFMFYLGIRSLPRPPILSRDLCIYVTLQAFNAVVRSDVMTAPNVLFILWIFIGNRLPWNKWGKKLKARTSSLTEVATAALKRQQTEAFQ